MQTIVYKVGGSLLSAPDIYTRLQTLLDEDRPCRPLVIVGGGETVDIVRQWDQRFKLTAEQAHWLAIAAMGLNEKLLASLLPSSAIAASRHEANECWDNGTTPILNTFEALRLEETSCETPLPASWDVTSDSIAAWIAQQWLADRLVMLKSIDLPTGKKKQQEAVDPLFPQIAESIPTVEWVNVMEPASERTVIQFPPTA